MDNSTSLEAPERLHVCQKGFADEASSGCSRILDPMDCAGKGCAPAQGIVDDSGTYLDKHSASKAVLCRSCDVDFTSESVNKDGKEFYVCSRCAAGRFQKKLICCGHSRYILNLSL